MELQRTDVAVIATDRTRTAGLSYEDLLDPASAASNRS
jgi:hypothetical protein